MEREKIEVGYRKLGTELGVDYHHKFLLYTDKTGGQYTISGWADSKHKTDELPNGNVQVKVNLPYDINNDDYPKSQKQYRETIIEGPDLSEKWAEMARNARTKDNIYPYDATRQNSNTLADTVLREAGLREPKLDGLFKHWSPASGDVFDPRLVPRSQDYMQKHKAGTIIDAVSLEEGVKLNPNLLNQPLAVNASESEMADYAFEALMSDDPVQMHKGLEQVFDTDVAKQSMQEAMQAVEKHNEQQALAEQQQSQVNAPAPRIMKL